MKRIRTIPEAAAEIQRADPNTYFTSHKLRYMIKHGVFDSAIVKSGTRVVLLDMDKLEAILDGQSVS